MEGRLIRGQAERPTHVTLCLDVPSLVLQDEGQAVEGVDVPRFVIDRHLKHGLPDLRHVKTRCATCWAKQVRRVARLVRARAAACCANPCVLAANCAQHARLERHGQLLHEDAATESFQLPADFLLREFACAAATSLSDSCKSRPML